MATTAMVARRIGEKDREGACVAAHPGYIYRCDRLLGHRRHFLFYFRRYITVYGRL